MQQTIKASDLLLPMHSSPIVMHKNGDGHIWLYTYTAEFANDLLLPRLDFYMQLHSKQMAVSAYLKTLNPSSNEMFGDRSSGFAQNQ